MARYLLVHISEHMVTLRDTYNSSGSHSNGSIGMLFVVLIIIIILGLIAGLLARLCGGHHFAGNIEYDFEGWVERTCASCIDGNLPSNGGGTQGGGKAAIPEGAGVEESKSGAGGGKGGEKKGGGKAGEKGGKKGGFGGGGVGRNKAGGKEGEAEPSGQKKAGRSS